MAEHHCHASGCLKETKPEMLMCARHWGMVPPALKHAVWRYYRPGQCDDKRPSTQWHAAAEAAIAAVSRMESRFLASGQMKALSILQPWAWLITRGGKDIENRSWSTPYRGVFLVHAGKKWGPEQRADVARIRDRFPGIALPDEFERGGIVGRARVIDCVAVSDSPWFSGPFGFVLADAKPLPFVPLIGRLGWFTAPGDVPDG